MQMASMVNHEPCPTVTSMIKSFPFGSQSPITFLYLVLPSRGICSSLPEEGVGVSIDIGYLLLDSESS